MCMCACVLFLSGIRSHSKTLHKQRLGRKGHNKIERNLIYWQVMIMKIMHVIRQEILQVLLSYNSY